MRFVRNSWQCRRLDPPRVAILPTTTAGNNNSVPIRKAAL